MDKLESFGYLRDVDAEAGRVTAIISTGDIARDGAIIDPKGWDFSNYDRNPVVLWMHDANAIPFARTIERVAGDKELIAKAQFDMEDARGAEMFRKIQGGFVNSTSVRWLPRKTEVRKVGEKKAERDVLVFLEQELLEWSFVTVPADPKALIMRAEGGALDLSEYMPKRDIDFKVTVDFGGVEAAARAAESTRAAAQARAGEQAQIEDEIADYLARRMERPTVDDLIVRTLATTTGKTEERIRRELAGSRRE